MSCDRVPHRTRSVRVSLIFRMLLPSTKTDKNSQNMHMCRAGKAEHAWSTREFRIAVKPAAMPLRLTRPLTLGHRVTKGSPASRRVPSHLSRCDHVVQQHPTRGRPATRRPGGVRAYRSPSGSHTSSCGD